MAEIVKMTTADAGCLVDGHHGIYGPKLVIDLAIDCGWNPPEDPHTPFIDARWMNDPECDPATRDDCAERVLNQGGWLDDAEAWLNEHCAPEGYRFGWHEGEFFLSPMCEDEEACSDETCWHWT